MSSPSGSPSPRAAHDPVVFRLSSSVQLHLSSLTYAAYTSIGIALLWPWNCYLSASAYYGDRFSDTPGLSKAYSSTFMSVSTVTTMLTSYYLSQKQEGVNYHKRIFTGLVVTVAIFAFLALTCYADFFIFMKDYSFFGLLMVTVLLSGMASSLAQNGALSSANVLGSIYTNGVMVGQAIAGALPPLALICSLLLTGKNENEDSGESHPHKAKNVGLTIYFLSACLVALISVFMLGLANRYKNASAYVSLDGEEGQEDAEEPIQITQKKHVPFGLLWSKLKLIVMAIFITFCITLVFPVFASTVTSVRQNPEFVLFKKSIYIPFIYLVWNMGDLVGRVLCGMPNSYFLVRAPKKLINIAILRLVFIPLFMTCNIHPGTSSPVISSDAWYVLLQFLFGFSNGQLCTSCFMVVGDNCTTDEEKEAAGGFATVFLTFGLAVGSLLSYLFVPIVG
ncbi:hypothetical protein FT663_00250 [Candidozyma haemuli var. vulneris]|nr:hypothetical protein FT662_00500 [[Candida] haemuloni var. vulneris]KAF3995654.1 hypothetical protein FT663_00250 [[Candida] haemuloni var. vulneris]